jgi:hypothetical protein
MLLRVYPRLLSLPKFMGRQHTLGIHIHLMLIRAEVVTRLAGKYFDMPKGIKSAPPQQSNLQDMWGKKKAKPAPAVPADAPAAPVKTPDTDEDMPEVKSEPKASSSAQRVSETPTDVPPPAGKGKRKQVSEPSEGTCLPRCPN